MKRSRRAAGLGILVAAAGALALGAPARAVEVVPVKITVQSNAWSINGDLVRQPLVPMLQKIDTPVIILTDNAIVNPTRDAVTQVAIPDNFGGTQTVVVTRTTMGNKLLLPNPTNRFDPFTGKLTNVADGDAGTASLTGGPQGNKGGEFPINLFTHLCLDEIEAGGCFFVADIPGPGEPALQFGVNVTVMFDGLVALLSIPIDGTVFGTGWTTGMVTISRQVTTMRRFDDPAGTPTGFTTVTFMSTGSFMKNVSSAITPFVVESFAGRGPERIPNPFYGFLRSKIEGLTFVPEPGSALWLGMAAGLGGLAWRRRREEKGRARAEA